VKKEGNNIHMHRNYFLFEKQVKYLSPQLKASTIVSCFTHRKNELVIHIDSDEELFLRISLDAQTPYFVTYKARNIKDPRTFFFKELNGKKIQKLKISPYDKIIYLITDDLRLKCIFYGKEKNIVLIDSEKKIISSFKKISPTEKIPPPQLSDLLSADDFMNFERAQINQPLKSFLTAHIGGFNKLLSEEACFRADIQPATQVNKIPESIWKSLSKRISDIKEEIKQDECYLYEHANEKFLLSLVKLEKLPDDYKVTIYPAIDAAWKEFIYRSQQKATVDKILYRSRERILRRIKYLEKTLKKVTDFKELEEKKIRSELKGHLLYTFSSEIKKGTDLVKLKNIYTTGEEYISIKLNPKLSIQENASRYFNKFKDIDTKKEILKVKQDTYQDELFYWKKIYQETEKIDNLEKAEKLEQLLAQKKLFQRGERNEKPASRLDISSFNRVLLNGSWEIIIGKNAENNDLLTFKFARKYDIWLHAQGVPGSHVIIRLPDKNNYPPIKLIEQAASIAAYFSSARNSSTVPVNYTEVRYVRKPRKAPPGTAQISNSKTIFVEPKKYI
jgi:predicted ribosome quality control (RQC) complex YloA/Tae2 family protein